MGIRQTINENPAITGAVAGGITLLAIIFIFWQFVCSGPGGGPINAGKQYFTTDEGKTWFADDATNIPEYVVEKPGDPNHGKKALRARVFRCGETGKLFVNHLEKYSEADKKEMQEKAKEIEAKGGNPMGIEAMGFYPRIQVKRPGQKRWVSMMSGKAGATDIEAYNKVVRPTCPQGETGTPIPVLPGPDE